MTSNELTQAALDGAVVGFLVFIFFGGLGSVFSLIVSVMRPR